MSKTVDFIFDFASPNAYLVHRVIPEIEARTGARFNYIPCLLGGIFKETGNQAPMVAFGGIKNKPEYDMLELQRFVTRHKLMKYKLNPHFPVMTVMVMRGALVAEEEGFLADYIEAMLVAMWENGLKLDDAEVLHQAYSDAGFDADHIMARMGEDGIKSKLIENTAQAVARGAFGIPTFFVGDEIFFGKERLGQVEELL